MFYFGPLRFRAKLGPLLDMGEILARGASCPTNGRASSRLHSFTCLLETTVSVSVRQAASLVSAGKGSETGATGRDERVQLARSWEPLQFVKSPIREFEARPVD